MADLGLGWKIAIAVALGFFVIRMWPAVKHWNTEGPKGSSSDWMTALLLFAGVAAFVGLLIAIS